MGKVQITWPTLREINVQEERERHANEYIESIALGLYERVYAQLARNVVRDRRTERPVTEL